MGDFTEKSVVKSATRSLAAPIADYATFSALIQDILENNPWGCTAYESAGAAKPAVEKSKEAYAATIVYENAEAKTVGTIPVRGPSMAAVNTAVTQITGNSAITTGMGTGVTASHDSSGDSFSCTIKAHNSNGELYTVTFKRDSISLSSYESDTIRAGLETWADTVAILA
ncbi:hypothetical protein [Methanospirillum lacunae]|uniref:Uncharacterized protein n=1 Tax=Methanospirillum lacunae TaxID=668570 RepID=A0A2V2MTP6_9EURY|nr:hypothetical protein [Methanospirillum lacunae]PWR71402.1 hypothetical protein DK846_11085 [Methanospirillum lacunae]